MKEYFYGRYYKCQTDTDTVAFIASYSKSKDKRSASVQIITKDGAYNADFPFEDFSESKDCITIGRSRFSDKGVKVDIEREGLNIKADIAFGKNTPVKYDIMGPFRFVPFMECRHSVYSMLHTVSGKTAINGKETCFDGGKGYTEGDRGRSFPRVYAWTHAFTENGSLMLSVAEIPIGKIRFTGIIGVVYIDGKEYRIATYKGAKAEKIKDGEIVIKQKNMRLTAKLTEKRHYELNAPSNGEMTRLIRESAECGAYYKLEINGKTLFETNTEKASFEYEL
ncbi:MAG: hypothetical protein II135_01660 [Clostridia bacterium]|nr:hypothetical protein [Clostridia bacterium]